MSQSILVVADAGGTSTDWWIFSPSFSSPLLFTTGGINASVSPDSVILESLGMFKAFLQECLGRLTASPIAVRFFGAGCNSDVTSHRLMDCFKGVFGDMSFSLTCRSDLEGAALALFGDSEGIACILGTGSASCLFDGERVVDSVPSLGYILGDEGSGAHMGRLLLNSFYKRELSSAAVEALRGCCPMELTEILRKVYREPGANGFLASFVPFLKNHADLPDFSALVDTSLKLFFEKNVFKYKYDPDCSLGFVGGVACAFEHRLHSLAASYGFKIASVIHRPIEALGAFFKECYFYEAQP